MEPKWYYVIRISDYHHLFSGTDPKAAKAANVQGTHLVAAGTLGETMRQCALQVGEIKRGLKQINGNGIGDRLQAGSESNISQPTAPVSDAACESAEV